VLVDGPLLGEVIDQLGGIARDLPVLFPMHPRTRKMLGDPPRRRGVVFADPLGYLEFLSVEADAAAVLTDSGGLQEETTYLGVRCFTLRDNTDRPVTVRLGTNTLLGLEPARIAEILPSLAAEPVRACTPPPLWDGHAAARAADVVENALAARRAVAAHESVP
jgi:UDP-N-acetylglucosamine 2-epimerase (non-hydrolysing)